MIDLTKLADRLKAYRNETGLSQMSLANETGIGVATIYNIESGRTTPNLLNLVILADFYGVTVSELLGEE